MFVGFKNSMTTMYQYTPYESSVCVKSFGSHIGVLPVGVSSTHRHLSELYTKPAGHSISRLVFKLK